MAHFRQFLFLQLHHSNCSCDISFAVVTLQLQFSHLSVLLLHRICSCAIEIAVVLMKSVAVMLLLLFVVRDRPRAMRVSSPRSKNSHSILRQARRP